MLTLNIPRIARLKGVQRPITFLIKSGFTAHTAKKLYAGAMQRVDLRDIELLCYVFRCTPHDLFDHRPNKDRLNDEPDHLAFLSKEVVSEDMQSAIGKLSLSETEALYKEAIKKKD